MPRYNVQRPDGKWACLDTDKGKFITKWMNQNRYQEWRRKEYGLKAGPLETAVKMDFEKAMEETWTTGM